MPRYLIVDDSRRFLAAARALLERQGLTVVGVATNASEAVRQVEELRPDVVLLDLDLGGESGFDLARCLRAVADDRCPRLILISTHAEEDYADLIADSPAVGFLPKAELSATAIRRLLAPQARAEDPGQASERPGT